MVGNGEAWSGMVRHGEAWSGMVRHAPGSPRNCSEETSVLSFSVLLSSEVKCSKAWELMCRLYIE